MTSKRQVTIPRELRERAGLMPGADVEFEFVARTVRGVKAKRAGQRSTRGQKLLESVGRATSR